MKKILITGSAGFIGANLQYKLEQSGLSCCGIDSLSDYYDQSLKLKRLKYLTSSKNKFFNIDLCNVDELSEILKNNKFDAVIHLAAQAGVRYSFKDPMSYINSNIVGTLNLISTLNKYDFSGHLLIASTSSIYGKNDNLLFKENDPANSQVSLYASTKKSVESIAHNFSYNFKIKTTILRFFTVYGPWGRPDMALFNFVNSIDNNRPIDVYNNGEMYRDFTYIEDLVESIIRLLEVFPEQKYKVENDSLSNIAPYRIVNIGNQKVIKLTDFITNLENIMSKKAIYNLLPMQQGDVPYTLADCSLLKQLTGYSPNTNIKIGVEKFYNWYKDYYILKKYK